MSQNRQPDSIRIVGIDPGSRKAGYGIIDRVGSVNKHVASGVIRLDVKAPLPNRLVALEAELSALLEEHRPDQAAVEEIFFAKNAQSALILGHARGVALFCLAARGVPIVEYTPAVVKKSVVGGGRAEKDQVRQMVQILLNLRSRDLAEDESDALAIALTHSQHFHRRNLEESLNIR